MLCYIRKKSHSQTGSTQIANLVFMAACAFIALVVLLARVVMDRV